MTKNEVRRVHAGDIYLINLDPTVGSEQSGIRPVIVVSSDLMNQSKRMLICPITTNMDFWTTKVPLPDGTKTKGMVLSDQLRSVDKNLRTLRYVESVPAEFVTLVRSYIGRLLELEVRQT